MGMTKEEVISTLKVWVEHDKAMEYADREENIEIYKMAIKALEQQPSKGHWIKTGDYYTGAYECLDYFECSCCHEESLEEGDYCPNCGAKMEVKE